jgi:hypothetical protein
MPKEPVKGKVTMADLEPIAGILRDLVAQAEKGDETQVELHAQQIEGVLASLLVPRRLPYTTGSRSPAPPIIAAVEQGFGLKRVRKTLASLRHGDYQAALKAWLAP